MKDIDSDAIRNVVRDHYAKIPVAGSCGCQATSEISCCGASQRTVEDVSQIMGYSEDQIASVIKDANFGLGCGNPTAIGKLKPGETVLDLGSGGGFDCFIAAKQVGEKGYVIGVDMNPEMLSKARKNAEKMGTTNVEFRLGEIEHLPIGDNTVDVIISNCVINLSPEKAQVFKDAYRVLKPGGRLAISDVVATSEIPKQLREQAELLSGCISGAEHFDRIRELLDEVGFKEIKIELKAHSKELVSGWFPGSGAENFVASADIEAVKPLGRVHFGHMQET